MANDELTDNGLKTDHPSVSYDEYVSMHGEPVYEGDDKVVFADESGQEISEWAEVLEGVEYEELYQTMHNLARDVYGRDESNGAGDPWSVTYPVVFDAETFEE